AAPASNRPTPPAVSAIGTPRRVIHIHRSALMTHDRPLTRLLVLLALLLVPLAQAQPADPRTLWAHETGDTAPDPAAVWGRLESGLRYVVLPNDTPKARVSLRLLVDVGSFMEREDQRGLAHF